jgi:hypothetical protein
MSKKQQRKKERRHNEKKRGVARIGLEALERKVRAEASFGGREVVLQTDSSEKMSEVLLAFVEPYLEYATTRDAFERLIAIGALAWNAALASPEDRHSLLDETSKSIQESAGEEDAEVYRALVNDLIKRKERYFANNKRLIATYQVTEGKGRFHLAVASSPAERTS